jgi:hypothetical protein
MKHRKFPLAPRPALLPAFAAAAAQTPKAHDLCNPKRPHRVKMRAFFPALPRPTRTIPVCGVRAGLKRADTERAVRDS